MDPIQAVALWAYIVCCATVAVGNVAVAARAFRRAGATMDAMQTAKLLLVAAAVGALWPLVLLFGIIGRMLTGGKR